jgi:uncharacterized protein YbaA (DUF1428 family)
MLTDAQSQNPEFWTIAAVVIVNPEGVRMARYVDGFVLPVPKRNIDAYLRQARKAGKIWREHGALEYRECIAEDVKPGELTFVPAERQSQARRDRGVLLDRVQVACASRSRQRQGIEGPAPGRPDGPEASTRHPSASRPPLRCMSADR